MSTLQCCCGRPECAYLEHNNVALEGLEKDVETAARLGQALLVRHETYMAEAEQERRRMSSAIEKLEEDKRSLEAENARMIEANRGLLNQLEELNNANSEADAHLKSLTANLQAAQLEVKRLGTLAGRTAMLEEQLAAMEAEQHALQQELATTKEDERSALHRWRDAEKTLRNLQDQVERIEKEAREEKERHIELVGRMERKRAVEKELDNAAGRLKGAAAVSSLGRNKNGTSVVSHFVRDILQDNANLQMGIVELREMLQASNDEVQNLRDQVMLHQPVTDNENTPTITPLSEELHDRTEEQKVSPELHVHHHYHAAPSTPRKERMTIQRHPKKKRGSGQLGVLTPSTGTATPRTPTNHTSPSSASTILSHTSVTIPQPPNPSHRLSTQSTATGSSIAPSSLPSSPQTDYRSSSIFDRVDYGFESSRPTSPESSGFVSPNIFPIRDKRLSNLSYRSLTDSAVFNGLPSSVPSTNPLLHRIDDEDPQPREPSPDKNHASTSTPGPDSDHQAIPEENENPDPTPPATETTSSPSTEDEPNPLSHPQSDVHDASPSDLIDDFFGPVSRLRHSTSHESLISISGMDIHTLKSHPSQLLITGNNHVLTSRPNTQVSATTALADPSSTPTPKPTFSTPLSSSPISVSTQHLLSTLPSRGPRAPSILSNSTSDSDDSRNNASLQSTSTLSSRLLGGWVFGKWGVAPSTTSSSDLRAKAMTNNATRRFSSNNSDGNNRDNNDNHSNNTDVPTYGWGSSSLPFRASGVNQIGSIRGLKPPSRTPSQVHAVRVDEEGLRDAIGENGT